MTEERLVLAELREKAGEGDFLRAVAEAVLQLLMETDVEGLSPPTGQASPRDRSRPISREQTLFERVAERKLRRRPLTDEGNVEIIRRDLRWRLRNPREDIRQQP